MDVPIGDVPEGDVEAVGLGRATPVVWGRLSAPACISTILVLVVLSTAGAIQIWLFARS